MGDIGITAGTMFLNPDGSGGFVCRREVRAYDVIHPDDLICLGDEGPAFPGDPIPSWFMGVGGNGLVWPDWRDAD